MDYAAQKRFLDSYNLQWLAGAAAIIIVASLVLRDPSTQTITFFSITTLTAINLAYLPKYLHIHHEPDKRYRWTVRARWILSGLGLLISASINARRPAWLLLSLAAALWLLMVNTLVKIIFRRREWLSDQWMPVLYFLGDLWMIAVLALLEVDWFIVAAVLVLLPTFSVVLSRAVWMPLLAIGASALLLFIAALPVSSGFRARYMFAAVALTLSVAGWLTRTAAQQAQRNHQSTVCDLVAFTGLDRIQAEQKLLSSRQSLVEEWKRATPNESDKDALARWYAEQSLLYLFDIAQFHLTYKHIVFTLDVLKLSRGRCLDFGAGKGELSIALAQRSHEVVYFDVAGKSREYAEWNASRRNLRITFTSERRQVANAGPYDTIISLDVLEHLPDLEGELRFLGGVLTPGGRMILTLPVGATESHPMHLAHRLDARAFLREFGLRDVKNLRMKLFGSEILRKRECLVFQKPI